MDCEGFTKFQGLQNFKGIFSDSINIFHAGDINKKSLFPKFLLIPILRFQVMHDYVCFITPIDFCVETFCENCSQFHTEMISGLFLWGSVLLRQELNAKNSNFENFESALYSTSGSMPLSLKA